VKASGRKTLKRRSPGVWIGCTLTAATRGQAKLASERSWTRLLSVLVAGPPRPTSWQAWSLQATVPCWSALRPSYVRYTSLATEHLLMTSMMQAQHCASVVLRTWQLEWHTSREVAAGDMTGSAVMGGRQAVASL